MNRTITSAAPDDTVAAGRELAARLEAGAVIALRGEIGAGKTHFVRGLVEGWGGNEAASSPTFTLVHEYSTPRGPIYHLDLYRADSAEEIWSAAQDELSSPHGLVVVEWADRFPGLLPTDAVRVSIAHTGNGRREITIETCQ